jgi:hypothetical protein
LIWFEVHPASGLEARDNERGGFSGDGCCVGSGRCGGSIIVVAALRANAIAEKICEWKRQKAVM